jgi:ribosomal protein L12E/L44/L45/RPP1/RPP2
MNLKLLADTPPWEWPGDAGRTFRKALNNPQADPADRLIAAELAGDATAIDNDLANVLLAILRNNQEPEELRAQSAISFGPALELADTEIDDELGEFDDPEMVPITEGQFRTIQDALRRVYSDAATPKLVRRRILEASVRARADWHTDAIREAYASGDREWMLTAVFGMRYVDGFAKEILEALGNPDPEIHYEAVMAAGTEGLDAAWPHVLKLVEDESTEKKLRIAAIEAIGQIRPAEARGMLIELTGSLDEDISDAAEEALSFLGSDDDDDEDFEDDDEDDEFDEDEEDEDEDEEDDEEEE